MRSGTKRAAMTIERSFPVAPGRLRTPYARAIGEMPFPTFEINREAASE